MKTTVCSINKHFQNYTQEQCVWSQSLQTADTILHVLIDFNDKQTSALLTTQQTHFFNLFFIFYVFIIIIQWNTFIQK